MSSERRSSPREGREATRAAILRAAQVVFTENGYEGAGVREIASRAGSTATLINRYFGGKEALFEEALSERFDFEAAIDLGTAGAIVRYLADKAPPQDGGFDPMIAMLRSVGSPVAEEIMRRGLEAGAVQTLSRAAGTGEGSGTRGAMLLAIMSGYVLFREVLKLPSLAQQPEEAERLLETVLASLMQADAPGDPVG